MPSSLLLHCVLIEPLLLRICYGKPQGLKKRISFHYSCLKYVRIASFFDWLQFWIFLNLSVLLWNPQEWNSLVSFWQDLSLYCLERKKKWKTTLTLAIWEQKVNASWIYWIPSLLPDHWKCSNTSIRSNFSLKSPDFIYEQRVRRQCLCPCGYV